MKIYLVTADNGESYEDYRWWNVAACISEEVAQEYILKFSDVIKEAYRRIYEIEEKWDNREISDSEKEEYRMLQRDYGMYYEVIFARGKFDIEELELHE